MDQIPDRERRSMPASPPAVGVAKPQSQSAPTPNAQNQNRSGAPGASSSPNREIPPPGRTNNARAPNPNANSASTITKRTPVPPSSSPLPSSDPAAAPKKNSSRSNTIDDPKPSAQTNVKQASVLPNKRLSKKQSQQPQRQPVQSSPSAIPNPNPNPNPNSFPTSNSRTSHPKSTSASTSSASLAPRINSQEKENATNDTPAQPLPPKVPSQSSRQNMKPDESAMNNAKKQKLKDVVESSQTFGVALWNLLRAIPVWAYIVLLIVIVIIIMFVFAPRKVMCEPYPMESMIYDDDMLLQGEAKDEERLERMRQMRRERGRF